MLNLTNNISRWQLFDILNLTHTIFLFIFTLSLSLNFSLLLKRGGENIIINLAHFLSFLFFLFPLFGLSAKVEIPFSFSLAKSCHHKKFVFFFFFLFSFFLFFFKYFHQMVLWLLSIINFLGYGKRANIIYGLWALKKLYSMGHLSLNQ